MFSLMFAFSRINDFISLNFYFWNLNEHLVLETVTLFSSVGINYFKISLLKEYQRSVLTHKLPPTKIAQKLYLFLLVQCSLFYVQRLFQGDSGTFPSKSLGCEEVTLKNPYSKILLQTHELKSTGTWKYTF